MDIVRTFGPINSRKPGVVLAVGFFDGVHLGHQHVIAMCREQAAARQAAAWIMTFEPHPITVLRPADAPRLLTSLETKIDLMAGLDVDGVMVVPFTRAFSLLAPEVFLAELHGHLPGLEGIVVGQNWRFGHQAAGHTAWLRERAGQLPFRVTIAGQRDIQGQTISSSRIRSAIAHGQLDEAARMLGRNHRLRGRVIDGLKRGRRLGFPTANMDMSGYALPSPGIYSARVQREQKNIAAGAVYIPAGGPPGLLEVHLIDFHGDLYGEELTVEFTGKIRDDNLRFDREEELVRQISSDVQAIREKLQCHD